MTSSTKEGQVSNEHQDNNQGSLVCVGTGMRLAGQLTPIAKSHIQSADIVIGAVSNNLSRHWLKSMAKDYICLWSFYGDGSEQGKSRKTSYHEMAQAIIEQVKQGKRVCAVFYGHPGVFACIGHLAISQLKKMGYPAQMLPGISAEDCLVADLGIDPGAKGMQSMEATQYLINRREIDPSALLVLWQPGIVGDLTLKRFDTCEAHVSLLVEKLSRLYSLQHQVILYEAATNPLQTPRIDYLALEDLPQASMSQITTLVIPATAKMVVDEEFRAKLQALEVSG
jgi:precorrin-3B methylase